MLQMREVFEQMGLGTQPSDSLQVLGSGDPLPKPRTNNQYYHII